MSKHAVGPRAHGRAQGNAPEHGSESKNKDPSIHVSQLKGSLTSACRGTWFSRASRRSRKYSSGTLEANERAQIPQAKRSMLLVHCLKTPHIGRFQGRDRYSMGSTDSQFPESGSETAGLTGERSDALRAPRTPNNVFIVDRLCDNTWNINPEPKSQDIHTVAMGEYQRKRLNIACDVCRGRRTKCDGQRPKCGFCQVQGSRCVYQAAPQPPPSRLELDIAAMRERLEDIMGVLVSDQRQCKDARSLSLPTTSRTASLHASFQSSPRALSDHEAKYEPDDPEFPIMILQRRSMMVLLDLDPDMGVWLSNMERSTSFLSRRDQDVSMRVFLLPPESISSTLQAFSERVHVWLPILSSDFQESFHQCINGQSPSPSDTCLAMLVMALGSFAAGDTITSALSQQLGTEYFTEASKLLPDVLLDFSVRSLQCLIFFAVYFMHLIRPCQAHDYVLMASARAQNMLKIHSQTSDTKTVEALRRAYWAILLIESELSVQIDLPDSGIWKHEEETQLPSPNGIWHFSLTENSAMSSPSSQTLDSISDTIPVYFLAEVAMRRMLRRCTTSLSKSSEGEFRYAPVIARELELQLDGWKKYLPPFLDFQQQPTELYEVAEVPRAQFLQAQFFACKASISWPAVYETIRQGFVDENMLPYCTKFFDDYVSFILAATKSMQTCMMNTWTLATSIFIITMAAIRAIDTDGMEELLNPQVFHCFSLAAESFAVLAPYSKSLAALVEIIRERVEHTQYRLILEQ